MQIQFYSPPRADHFFLTCVVLALLITSGCSDHQDDRQVGQQKPSAELAVNRTPPNTTGSYSDQDTSEKAPIGDSQKPLVSAPRLRGQAEAEGNGLDFIIFAGDREQYAESLQIIAESTTDEQYQQLDAAIRWLLINDPSIMNKEDRLFEQIDGKTGTEILQMFVNRRKAARQ